MLSGRPGRVLDEFAVDLPRPRSLADPRLADLRHARGAARMTRYLLAGLLVALFVAAWQGVATLDSVDDLTLASPVETCGRCATTGACCATTPA